MLEAECWMLNPTPIPIDRFPFLCHSPGFNPLRMPSRTLLFLFVLLALAGCRARQRHPAAAPVPREANIDYLGHNSFVVSSSLGLKVLIDPFDPAVLPYPVKPGTVAADIVLVTHEDETANDTDLAGGSPVIIRSSMATGVNRANGVLIRGVRTSSESLAANAKVNVAYIWSMDGIRFCHLGAIEDAVSTSEALNIGTVDVLFLPVGGPPAFTDDKRKLTIERLQPRIIIPMMYATSHSGKLPLRGLGEWLSRQGARIERVGSHFTVMPNQLPSERTIVVMSPQ